VRASDLRDAANQEGDFSVRDMQEHLNKWLPRGFEMFGNEEGGGTNVEFGFKSKTNGVAQAEYDQEVRGVVKDWNCAMIQQAYRKGTDYDTAKGIVEHIWETKDEAKGITPEMILFSPNMKFFRKRGLEEFVFKPFDLYGELITGAGGAAVGPDKHIEYLKTELPDTYFSDPEWKKFERQLREYHDAGGEGGVKGASYSG